MLSLIENDKKLIDNHYKNFLVNFRDMLKESNIKSDLYCSIKIINMLHSGYFSMYRTISFSDNFKFLNMPNIISRGVQVMYGVACCRHTSALLNDILQTNGICSSVLYIFIDENNDWHISNLMSANHVVVLLNYNGYEYILDSMNKFVLRKDKNQKLIPLCLDASNIFPHYQDPNIQEIGKVLKKYYDNQKFGIEHIYDYKY